MVNPLIASRESVVGAGGRSRLLGSERLLLATVVVGTIHNVDHVLRFDHSGWPFRAEVTPFTYSQIAYPILLIVFLARSRPWLRVVLTTLILVGVQIAHLTVELPSDQYATWANGVSTDPDALGVPNLLGISSPVLGLFAAGWSLLLSVMLALTTVALVRDARRRRADDGRGG